ncbi:leucine-rich repeat protein 1-like [Miscanthus floridulus]|uniref:leucine-rich repeat protein 1-like n=1 Tax=Miscanthus floridulus TaxID=154761 RepID=UPI0034594B02
MALDKVRSSAAAVMGLVVAAAALLSPPAPGSFNDEVNTLVEIKKALNDPSGVLRAWDPEVIAAGDELCDWPMVVCNVKDQVFRLDLSNQNLSGTLSPAIGNLRSMRNLLLCNNSISGLIPDTIGQIVHLETLDLSNNQFTGSIPSTLGGLAHLQYLELNKNSLSGHIPDSLATASMLSNLDLSFNNLSGPLPIFCASIVSFQGNPLLNPTAQEPHDFPTPKPANSEENSDVLDERDRILDILAVCLSVACVVTTLITGVIVVYRCRHRHEQAGAVDDVSSAISLTNSGLSQYSISSLFILP